MQTEIKQLRATKQGPRPKAAIFSLTHTADLASGRWALLGGSQLFNFRFYLPFSRYSQVEYRPGHSAYNNISLIIKLLSVGP